MAEKNTAIVPVEDYAIMLPDGNVSEIIAENLGGEAISPLDLDRVSVPSGGATTWTVPTLDGEEEVKALTGIIIHTQVQRVYWAEPFSGGGTPPDCISEDAVTGEGTPGGDCARCEFSKFGSKENGRAQACQMRRLVFMVRPDSLLPLVVSVPPSSLKPAKNYLLRLASRKRPAYSVITELTLEKDKNADGIAYSRINFRAVGEVPDVTVIRAYVQEIKPHLKKMARDLAQEAVIDPAEVEEAA